MPDNWGSGASLDCEDGCTLNKPTNAFGKLWAGSFLNVSDVLILTAFVDHL